MYARGTLLRFTSWVVLFSLTTFTFEGSVWAAERVSRDAKPVVTGDRDLPREARDALARIRRTISEQGIATSPPGNLRDFQPIRRGPQPVRFGPTLRGIDAAYEKFRAEFLAELEGQSGDSSRLTALANELKTFLAEYLDLLDKRGEYMVV